jgi:hypothetical protein
MNQHDSSVPRNELRVFNLYFAKRPLGSLLDSMPRLVTPSDLKSDEPMFEHWALLISPYDSETVKAAHAHGMPREKIGVIYQLYYNEVGRNKTKVSSPEIYEYPKEKEWHRDRLLALDGWKPVGQTQSTENERDMWGIGPYQCHTLTAKCKGI